MRVDYSLRLIEREIYKLTNWLIESVWQGASWEANISSDNEEIPCVLSNQKVRYLAHKSSPLVPVLSRINPFNTHPIPLRFLIVSSHLGVGFPGGLFPSDFPT